MSKFNILFISTACAVTKKDMEYGGIEKLLLDFVEPLHEEGHEITVAAPHGSEMPDGVHLFPTVTLPQEVWHEEIAFQKLTSQRLIPDGFDIIHDFSHRHLGGRITHGFWALPHPFMFMLWHPPYFKGMPNRISEPYYNLCAIARHQAVGLSQIYNQEVKWAYIGIDTDRYKIQRDKSDRYLFLSVPNKEKGGLEAIQIAKELDLNLDCICGQIPDQSQDYANQMKSLCDGEQIKWLGGVSETEKIVRLQNAKGMIFPVTQDEPFGLVMPEALSCGTPVFAFKRGAVPEILGEDQRISWVCDTYEQLKHGVRLFEEGEIEYNPDTLRNHAVKYFDRKVMVSNYKKLYQQVTKGEFWY